jgi:hypothetical protein
MKLKVCEIVWKNTGSFMLREFVMSNCDILDAITKAGNRGLVRVDDSHRVGFDFKSFPVFKAVSN